MNKYFYQEQSFFWLKQQHADKKKRPTGNDMAISQNGFLLDHFWKAKTAYLTVPSPIRSFSKTFVKREKCAAEVSTCQIPQSPSPSASPNPILQHLSLSLTSISDSIDGPHPYLPSPTAVALAMGCFLLGKKHVIPREAVSSVWLYFFFFSYKPKVQQK